MLCLAVLLLKISGLYKMFHNQSIYLLISMFCCLFLHGFSQKNKGDCPERSEQGCCYNFRFEDDECVECSPGYYGTDCREICPDGFYGRFCTTPCTPCNKTYCHHVYGCNKPEAEKTSRPYNIAETSTIILSSISTQTTSPPFSHERIDLSSVGFTQSNFIITTPVMREENNTNIIILAVGCAITLCLVIIIIQGVYKQISKSKRKRRMTVKQEEMAEIYSDIDERALVDLPNAANRPNKESTKDRNKYNVLNCELQTPGHRYQEIIEIPDRADVRSQGATDSDCSRESYLEPQTPAHIYTKVIDSDEQGAGPSSPAGCANYLDPVLEITPRMHAHLDKPVLSDSSESSVQYQDTVVPLDYGRQVGQNEHTSDKANALYLDATKS